MAVAAVAACTCAHHQSPKAEKKVLSCHGANHEKEDPEFLKDDPNRQRVSEQCNCFLNRVEPAITAKSEQKKFKTQQTDVAAAETTVDLDRSFVALMDIAPVDPIFSFYTRTLPRSGPSRAPPRL